MISILALTGSLRAGSRNTRVLEAAARLAPPDVRVTLYRAFDGLPAFNPDVESVSVPAPAQALRDLLAASDAVLVCSPEYAHGVPGAFKNALDWLVGVGVGRRPVGLINASPMSVHAHASLAEILATMDGVLVPEAVVVLPPPAAPAADVDALVADPVLGEVLRRCLAALYGAVAPNATAGSTSTT